MHPSGNRPGSAGPSRLSAGRVALLALLPLLLLVLPLPRQLRLALVFYLFGLIPGMAAFLMREARAVVTLGAGIAWAAGAGLPAAAYCSAWSGRASEGLWQAGGLALLVGLAGMLLRPMPGAGIWQRVAAVAATLVAGALLGLLYIASGFCHFGF
jgi:hypothetical protein